MASQYPDYPVLRKRAEQEWLTDGPNSGGVAGLLLVDDEIWWFTADWDPRIDGGPMPVAEFLARHGDSTHRGYAEAVAHLRTRHGKSP